MPISGNMNVSMFFSIGTVKLFYRKTGNVKIKKCILEYSIV